MTCFYVAGSLESLHNFLVLLDGFIAYKAKSSAKQFDIELHPHTGINLDDVWNQLSYENYSLHDPAQKLPLNLFMAQPVIGKRPVTMSLEFVDEKFSVVFHGQTYSFRGRMDGAGITGGYVGEGAARKYYRILKDCLK